MHVNPCILGQAPEIPRIKKERAQRSQCRHALATLHRPRALRDILDQTCVRLLASWRMMRLIYIFAWACFTASQASARNLQQVEPLPANIPAAFPPPPLRRSFDPDGTGVAITAVSMAAFLACILFPLQYRHRANEKARRLFEDGHTWAASSKRDFEDITTPCCCCGSSSPPGATPREYPPPAEPLSLQPGGYMVRAGRLCPCRHSALKRT